eukprot:CAMPEP_0114299330 /NCGR_PEP_ID=MMETSP0059-20121206/12914_1 /TAXON_ID=36894 /ORGANISM="Pyramimonas parkeae, Strain CCMP726" /LENGTH=588 /DNA_ID=CAMNT_0001421791 /DNA_START=305 /DNA_END=2072 /DNA_ORIENTATION=+
MRWAANGCHVPGYHERQGDDGTSSTSTRPHFDIGSQGGGDRAASIRSRTFGQTSTAPPSSWTSYAQLEHPRLPHSRSTLHGHHVPLMYTPEDAHVAPLVAGSRHSHQLPAYSCLPALTPPAGWTTPFATDVRLEVPQHPWPILYRGAAAYLTPPDGGAAADLCWWSGVPRGSWDLDTRTGTLRAAHPGTHGYHPTGGYVPADETRSVADAQWIGAERGLRVPLESCSLLGSQHSADPMHAGTSAWTRIQTPMCVERNLRARGSDGPPQRESVDECLPTTSLVEASPASSVSGVFKPVAFKPVAASARVGHEALLPTGRCQFLGCSNQVQVAPLAQAAWSRSSADASQQESTSSDNAGSHSFDSDGSVLQMSVKCGQRGFRPLAPIRASLEGATVVLCEEHAEAKLCKHEQCSVAIWGTSSFCMQHEQTKVCLKEGCLTAIPSSKQGMYCKAHTPVNCLHEGCMKRCLTNSIHCFEHGGGKRCAEAGCNRGACKVGNTMHCIMMEEDCAANTRAAISLTRETPDCVASMGGEHGVQIVTATSLQLVVACTAWLMVVVLAVNMTGAADAQQGGATASSACLTEAAFGAIT